ncbi:hypothetical protein [Streptomyces endocoffeicus]|uniref:hypothetical protein n=1 Tax=Streptomyces endocoffeicus TaxID=2898945 RepID=UPI001E354D99|nr:hypothetical protein [Streptomyces endocoffeicus]
MRHRGGLAAYGKTGRNAILALEELAKLGLPTGTCAADRAYTGCSPEHFQIPVRRLGYRRALDYKVNDRGEQGSWRGALLIDGFLACPHMPATLVHTTHQPDDKAVREIHDNQRLTDHITAREPHYLKTKQGPDSRGAVRLQCPASGPSPSVNCARRDRLRPRIPRTPGPPPCESNARRSGPEVESRWSGLAAREGRSTRCPANSRE